MAIDLRKNKVAIGLRQSQIGFEFLTWPIRPLTLL
ncbi:hypothetical protein COLO4_03815 [Corchorus olitorius]|uniref:Uncharacterized protein n=1 Tax=Corchorus olitorius TaxID=93759 RepID=A0A1R3KWD5_9ROSI|nr:hypothetical protein COLO4_03815 [Corchorus olitorius]